MELTLGLAAFAFVGWCGVFFLNRALKDDEKSSKGKKEPK